MSTRTNVARDDRRQQLLEVARVLFASRGYHDTSVSDIIEEASVARGTFYNYFESKRQIFGELLERLFEEATAPIRPIEIGPPDQMLEQVHRNIAGLCAALRENLPLARILFERAVGLDEEADLQLRAFYERAVGRIQTAIEDGQELGIVREGHPPVLATCLLGMIKESLYQHLLGTRTPDLDDVVAEIYAVAARGILVRPVD